MNQDSDKMEAPGSMLAAGWIPFTVCTLLSLFFSTVYILWFRSTREREKCTTTTAISIVSLTIILMTTALVPVDVFLVSYMKNENGTYKEWAKDADVRETLKDRVMYTYYAFYGIILALSFLVLPLNFFFHALGNEDDPDDDEYDNYDIAVEEPCIKRFQRALKYTSACLVLFGVFVIMGIFIPFGDIPSTDGNSTEWDSMSEWQHMVHIVESNLQINDSKASNLLVFLLNVLSLIGMVLLVIYTAYGMSSMPFGMIQGQRTVHTDRNSVLKQIEEIENEIRLLKAEFDGLEDNMTSLDRSRLERLEQQLRLLQRRRHSLDQSARTFVSRCIMLCRPFQFVLGSILALFGFLIFLSLMLSSIDKAMNSLGPKWGYILVNGTLPNPVDWALLHAQSVFPLDYIFYCAMILFFLFSSMAGVKNVGIRFLWLSVYKIRAQKTKPQALVLMCLNLIFLLLAIDVIMFSVVPDYTTYGNQNFINNETHKVEKCNDIEQMENECDMSRISVLLLAFHYKAWIFGAAYFYLTLLFLIVIVVGAVYKIYRMKTTTSGNFEDDEEYEELEDTLEQNNPFA